MEQHQKDLYDLYSAIDDILEEKIKNRKEMSIDDIGRKLKRIIDLKIDNTINFHKFVS